MTFSQGVEQIKSNERLDQYLVPGCLSKVWLITKNADQKLYIRIDSESKIIKATSSVYQYLLQDVSFPEILAQKSCPLIELGVFERSTSNRKNALFHIWEQITQFCQEQINK